MVVGTPRRDEVELGGDGRDRVDRGPVERPVLPTVPIFPLLITTSPTFASRFNKCA